MAIGIPHFFDADRLISSAGGIDGAVVYFYESGTTNLAPIYSDISLTTPMVNPVVIAAGQILPRIYLSPSVKYRRRVVHSYDGAVFDVDPYSEGIQQELAATPANDTGAALISFSPSVTYPSLTVGEALKRAVGSNEITAGNPSRAAGLYGFATDGLNSLTNQREAYTFSGARTAPRVGRNIELLDGGTGPASAAGSSTANSASYVLSLLNTRPNWTTSGQVGESDGLSIVVRQANGDAAGILSNVGVRTGFAAFAESYTFSADAAGAPIKAINTQIGVVNPRDGGEFGIVVNAATGTGLTAGFRASEIGSSSWAAPYQYSNSSGTVLWYVRGGDGATIGGSMAPRIDAGADLGAPTLRYNSAYVRQVVYSPYTVALLPAATGNTGMRAFVSDSSAVASGNFGASVSGGGSNKVPVYCDGTTWRIG